VTDDREEPTAAPPRRLAATERRRAILDAARPVFARRGFHGAGTADIASAANCSEPMLYKHFPSKLDLFAAVLDDASHDMRRRFEQAAADETDPIARLASLPRDIAATPEFAEKVRLRTLAVGMAHEPQVRQALLANADTSRACVADAVRTGQARGTVRPDIDPEHVAWLWVGITLAGGLRQALEGDEALREIPRVMDTLHSLLRLEAPEPRT